MKYLKMLGLAAVAAAALMAFAGASTASADELCTEAADATNMCPAGKRIEGLDLSLVGSAKKEDTSGNTLDTCTSGTWKITEIDAAHNNATGTSSVTGTTPAVDTTWGSVGTNCTFTTTTIRGGTVHFTHAAGGGTTVTVTEEETTINTGLFGSCVYGYGTGIDVGTIAQGGNTLANNVVLNKTSGAFCPSTIIWNATFKVTNHNAVFYITN
jgi:hypothetical protein